MKIIWQALWSNPYDFRGRKGKEAKDMV